MEEKSLAIINKINDLNLFKEDIEIKFKRLEGISNKIYNVEIKTKKEKKFDIFFKLFGKISGNLLNNFLHNNI